MMDSHEKQEPFGIDLTASVGLKCRLMTGHRRCGAVFAVTVFACQNGIREHDGDEPQTDQRPPKAAVIFTIIHHRTIHPDPGKRPPSGGKIEQ
jgi:hypothetical protein